MKKLLCLLLMAALLFTLVACDTGNTPGGTEVPGGEVPGGETPGDETPGGNDTPGGETPGPGEDTPPEKEPTPTPTLTLTPSAEFITEGSILKFTVSGEGYDAEDLSLTLSDTSLTAAPRQEGLVFSARALKAGELTATVQSGELTASCTVSIFPLENVITPDDPLIYYLGRTETQNDRVLLNNTAAGFEVKFYGKSITLSMGNAGGESVFSVFLDGETDPEAYKINLTTDLQGGKITLASFDEPGIHTLRVQKVSEEQISRASFASLTIEKGGLLPYTPEYAFKMEAYGASTTAGYGNLRAEGEPDDQKRQNGLLTYAGLAATALNAEYRTFCQSGLGLYTNPYNGTRWMKDIYANVSPASDTKWDMTSYTPDLVVIYVGANDIWAQNGSIGNVPFTAEEYIGHYVTFVKNLHAVYGDKTTFILCSGLMETGLAPSIKAVASQLRAAGIEAYEVVLPTRTGYGGHPCRAAHEEAAAVLTAKICDLFGMELPA
ncbi:MAG: hypothetical protein J6D31_06555 [Clostridia bacterium]|nr:hypothetical protein [Clostridia bacterium]